MASFGDEEIEELMASYSNLIKSICRKYYLAGGSDDDLYQEGMIGLFEAYKSFDKAKGDYNSENFKSFAKLCIKRQIIDAIKNANSKKNIPLNNYVSFASAGTSDGELSNMDTPDIPLLSVIDKEEFDEKVNNAISSLSAYEQQVIKLYIDGLSHKKIAEVLKKDVKSIYNTLDRIKQKIRGEKN